MSNNPQPKTYVDALFEAKRGFVIIGLTGYTGSGCTTTARILSKRERFDLPKNFGAELQRNGQSFGERHFSKLCDAWDAMVWQPYTLIEVGAIILAHVMKLAIAGKAPDAPEMILKAAESNKAALAGLSAFEKQTPISTADSQDLIKAYEQCVNIQNELKRDKERLPEYIRFMQGSGDNIRLFGSLSGAIPDPKNMFIIPESIRKVISSYKKAEEKSRFIIDAFRNPFEVEYFKRRYAEFYLLCIMRDHEERANSLRKVMATPDIEKIWDKEKGESPTGGQNAENCPKTRENIGWWVTGQNIPACAQKSDIYIKQKTKNHAHLHYHLARLLTLIHKPGSLTPSQDELGMQVAITAQHMSGCLSRQVGATVLGKQGYILGVGWNDPPEGQVPCSLRSCDELLNSVETDERAYSAFEQSDKFKEHINKKKAGKAPFCFRSELASLEGRKKAEYTRALHAEENAFLQTAKLGGTSLCGSTLYTTASTCTLCAKKAYQLEVERIVFIEQYPDHAHQQTILSGSRKIRYEQFEGVSGNSFFRLYAPIMSEKDLVEYYY